jgi:hypothetical protein
MSLFQKGLSFALSLPVLSIMFLFSLMPLLSGNVFTEAIVIFVFELTFVLSVICNPARRHAYGLLLLSLACHIALIPVLLALLLRPISTGMLVAAAITETVILLFLSVFIIAQAGILISRLLKSSALTTSMRS